MLLYNLLQHLRCTGMIPDSIGIDYRYRPSHTDPKAVGFGAKHTLLLVNPKLFKPFFLKSPRIVFFFITSTFSVYPIFPQKGKPFLSLYFQGLCFLTDSFSY